MQGADQVTLCRFRSFTARETSRVFDVRRAVVIQQGKRRPGFSDPACAIERH